jgi:Ca-activated chloride channel family protein
MILLSDGAQRDGTLQPLEAAQKAREAGIRIYTVALGTPDGVVKFDRGGFTRIVPVPPEPIILRDIARTTRGNAYTAENAEELSGVYRSLGSRLGRKKQPEEVTYAFAGVAALLLLASTALSALWAPKIP